MGSPRNIKKPSMESTNPSMSAQNNDISSWFKYTAKEQDDTLIHSHSYKYGILAITPNVRSLATLKFADNNGFFFKKTPFRILQQSDSDYTKRVVIFNPNRREEKYSPLILPGALENHAIKKHDEASFDSKNTLDDQTIINAVNINGDTKGKERVGLIEEEQAIIPKETISEKKIGYYVHVWKTGPNTASRFFGFDRFITAGCMFGPSLKAIDNHNYECPLMKHEIKVYDGLKFKSIKIDRKATFYEDMLFVSLEKNAYLINAFSSKDKPASLLYHLPYYDYMLFGISLFLRGRLSYDALDDLFLQIQKKYAEHVKKITKICDRHNINVCIESPFDNLFGPINENCTLNILSQFNYSTQSEPKFEPNTITDEQSKEGEKNFVQMCLKQLQNNSFNPLHQKVWTDICRTKSPDTIINIEDLLKLGNTMQVCAGTFNQKNNKICLLHPQSEMEIQRSYAKFSRSYKERATLPRHVKKAQSHQAPSRTRESKAKSEFYKSFISPFDIHSNAIGSRLKQENYTGNKADAISETEIKQQKQAEEEKKKQEKAKAKVSKRSHPNPLLLELTAYLNVSPEESRTRLKQPPSNTYPDVYNITSLETTLTYEHCNKKKFQGLLFYSNQKGVTKLAKSMMDQLSNNIYAVSHGKESSFPEQNTPGPSSAANSPHGR